MLRIFRAFIPSTTIGSLLSEAILIISCFLIATARQEDDFFLFLFYDNGWLRILLVAATVMLGLYLNDLYSSFRIRSKVLLVQQVCLALGITFLLQGLITYLNMDWRLNRSPMLVGSALVLVFLPLWRMFYAQVILNIVGAERLLFVGGNVLLGQIAAHLREHPELNMRCVGYLADDAVPDELAAERRLGSIVELKMLAQSIRPDRLVIGFSDRRQQLPVYDLCDLRLTGLRIEDATSLYEFTFRRVCLEGLHPSELVFGSHFWPGATVLYLQTLYSFLLALISILITSPLLLLIWIGLKATSPGPAIFGRTRIGRGNRNFTLYKFRTMYSDPELRVTGAFTPDNDPRVTPFGKWLRRTRLDELPQLFNVLKGDMAIVGPRPERPEFVRILAQQIPFYQQRQCVKPGITGLAQINHELEDARMILEYDLYYVRNLSPALDILILLHTVKMAFF
jgi:exopolysaccharide biosynthesis polyprenyl glycosylphosphotransferase